MCKFMRSTDEEYHYCRVLGFDYQVDKYMRSTPKGKPDWCPLREVPKKLDYPPMNESSYVAGYNACIDEILKEDTKNVNIAN